MPTENRSTMVSVPRDTVESAAELLQEYNKCGIARDLRALLDQPAQHQGEPIQLTAVATLVDAGDLGLEPSWLLEGGTAELHAGMTLLVADNAPELCREDGSAEVYTHPAPADPGEVERLQRRVQNADLALKVQKQNCDTLRAHLAELKNGLESQVVEGLRADSKWLRSELDKALLQLAERDALLQEIRGQSGSSWLRGETQHKLDAALSSSAESVSGTPLAQLTEAKRLLHTASTSLARWLDQDDDPRKQIIAFLEGNAEPSAPIAWHVGGNGYDRICFEQPRDLPGQPCVQAINDQGQLISLLKRYNLRDEEPSAPVERDERAEFEGMHDRTWPRCEFLHLSHHEYAKKLRWEGWQARASLERKPS